MATPTLYLYSTAAPTQVSVEAALDSLRSIAESSRWRHGPLAAVCQLSQDGHREVGFNYSLPPPHREPSDWFDDVANLVRETGKLRQRIGRDFVLGVVDAKGRCAEDLLDLDGVAPDLEYLRAFLGVDPPISPGATRTPH